MNINLIIHRYEEFDDDLGMIPRTEAVLATYQHDGETDEQFSIRTDNIVARLSTITHGERMKELNMSPPPWNCLVLDTPLYDGYLYIEGVEIIEK